MARAFVSSKTALSLATGHDICTPTLMKSPNAQAKSVINHSGQFLEAMTTEARRGMFICFSPAERAADASATSSYDIQWKGWWSAEDVVFGVPNKGVPKGWARR